MHPRNRNDLHQEEETDLAAHLKKVINETQSLPYLLQHDASLLFVNHDLSHGPEFRSDHEWQARFFVDPGLSKISLYHRQYDLNLKKSQVYKYCQCFPLLELFGLNYQCPTFHKDGDATSESVEAWILVT